MLLFLFLGLLNAFSPVRSASASTISNIPSDTRIHGYVEELGRRGLLRNFFFSHRPYSREQVMKGIAELDAEVSSGRLKLDPYEEWLADRLREEFGALEGLGRTAFQLGAELQGTGTSSKRTVTGSEAFPAALSGEKSDESEQSLRGVLFGWAEFTSPHGITLSHRFKVDTKIIDDPGFLGQVWRDDLGGYVANAYGKFELGPFGVLLGRDKLYWGPGQSGSLILSDFAPPLDMVSFSLSLGRVTATGFFTSLDEITLARTIPFRSDSLRPGTIASRHLSGHRLDVRIARNLEVGLSETVVYGGPNRGLSPGYINPLNFFYSEQWNLKDDDNPMWSLDATWWPKERLQVYGQFLVDDFQFEHKSEKDKEPQEIGFLLGLHSGDPFGLANTSFSLEYARVNPWTYNQKLPWNRYVFGNTLLGHPLGPDADAIYASVTKWLNDKFTGEVNYRFGRHGDTSVYSDWPVPILGPREGASFPDGSFPLGIVAKSHKVGVVARFHPLLHLDVDGFASFEKIANYRNVRDAERTDFEIGASVSFRPEWKFGDRAN